MLKPFEYFNQPQKAKLIAFFDYSNKDKPRELKQVIEFNPAKGLFPDAVRDYPDEGVVVMSLFHKTIQYGYILMRRGPFDTGVYDLISKAVASQLNASFEYSRRIKNKIAITQDYKMFDEIDEIEDDVRKFFADANI